MPSRSSDRRAQLLRGCTVFVARPAGHARPITWRLRELGADAIALPTASLRPTDDADAARATLSSLGTARATIFVSPAAVRHAFALSPDAAKTLPRAARDVSVDADAPGTSVIAVGPTTRRALARHGVDAVVPTRFDSEGVLALRALESVRGQRIVIVGAPGGRDAMRHALVERGATVEFARVYRRVLPRWTAAHRRAIDSAASPAALVVSSADALAVLVTLGGHAFLERFAQERLVVPSERVERAAQSLGFARLVRAASALPAALVEALAEDLQNERPQRVW